MHSPLLRLTNLLTDAGLPIDGVRDLGGGAYQPIWLKRATQADRDAAAAIVAGFDAAPRRARKAADVAADVAALSQNKIDKLLHRVIAEWLIANPDRAARLGVDVLGDEPDT